jgi:vacuolar-type H+-ATPase subunit I/STV1
MYVVNNSARALLIALIPVAMVHAVLTAMALLAAQANQPNDLPTPDQALMLYMTRLAADGALLFVGHCMLRQRANSSRIAYTLMGGAMAAAGYAIAIRNSLFSPGVGILLTIGLLPIIAGMIAGFLYGQFAGLAPARRFPPLSDEGPAMSLAFEGPTRVRTSVAAIVIAAMMPAVLTTILSISLASLLPGFVNYMSSGSNPVIAAALPAQLFLTFLVASILPSAIFVLCMHHIARALRRHRALAYAAIGGLMAALCAYLLSPMVPLVPASLLMIVAAAYGSIMGALYRRFAGLEPVPLPEAVIATDPNSLVGADHPARQQHRVILSN